MFWVRTSKGRELEIRDGGGGGLVVRVELELGVDLVDECRGPGGKRARLLQWLVHVHRNRLTLTRIRVVVKSSS